MSLQLVVIPTQYAGYAEPTHDEGAAASFLADFAIANVGHLGWICRGVMF